jgi:hypothetical protein
MSPCPMSPRTGVSLTVLAALCLALPSLCACRGSEAPRPGPDGQATATSGSSREAWDRGGAGTQDADDDAAPGGTGRNGQAAAGPRPRMEKYVSKAANFVIYRPTGWNVQENSAPASWVVGVTSPDGALELGVIGGKDTFGGAEGALVAITRVLAGSATDLRFERAARDAAGTRSAAAYRFTHPAKGPRESRLWIHAENGSFLAIRCEAPAGRLDASLSVLMSIAGNLRIMKAGFSPEPAGGAAAPVAQPLQARRLPDGSATVALPAGWTLQGFPAGQFFARNPDDGASFVVGAVDAITPRMGVHPAGVRVSPYLEPAQAWRFATEGLIGNIRYIDTRTRPDIDAQIARVFTGGPVRTAELFYTFDGKDGMRGKGYTFGISFGSRLDTNWKFWHITLTAPEGAFNSYIPTFVNMAQSYAIDDQYARNYIAAGMARLRQMQAETSRIVAQNARDIHQMMQDAYDERQRSQEYIDYQRSNYIRGETDWISGMEGGTVYHSDAWGTQNTYTGERWDGAPFDAYNFNGENPKHNESMTPIDNRELYEKVFH